MDFIQLKNDIIDGEYRNLNPMQKQAVYQVEGPLLILAGAGSGKTTVLINRIANLVTFGNARNSEFQPMDLMEEDKPLLERCAKEGLAGLEYGQRMRILQLLSHSPARPWQVLAITFTNKAANEIKERLGARLGEDAYEIWAGTFHWACARILRREIGNMGYGANFTIYDTDDSRRVVKECLKELGISEKQFHPKQVQSVISRYKDQLIDSDRAVKDAGDDYRLQVCAKVYVRYQARLQSANALDFDDMIFITVRLFEKYPDILDHYQNRFRYIMVDEYQDTNHAQYRLITLLAQKYKNICVVGDDDQSIYRFRGATIENILGFEDQFEHTQVIRLEQNYRSTQNILDAANALIGNNTMRKGKNLWTDNGEGDKLRVSHSFNESTEAQYIRSVIEENVKSGMRFSNHAILYRMNAQSNSVERDFARAAIPYRIIGGHRFYERKEIKDVMSYLAVINNPNDVVRMRRIINEPKRGIGDATLATAEQIAQGLEVSLFDVLAHADAYPLLARKAKALMGFAAVILHLISESEAVPPHELYEDMLDLTGYRQYLTSQGTEGEARLENIQELGTNIIHYSEENPEGDLSGFLEEVSLFTDIDNYDADADAVVMMTIHAAKGLEFPVVFIAGMEEGIFPGMQASFDTSEVEEERRLAYVAVTRAKERLYITTTQSRMLFGRTERNRPSRFLQEIPLQYKEVEDSASTGEESQATVVKKKVPTMYEWKSTPKVEVNKTHFEAGDRVVHNVFGEGNVVSAKAVGNDTLLEITFDSRGSKKIMANFAKIEKV